MHHPVGSGFPRFSSTGTVSIMVADENDNPPTFSQTEFRLSLLVTVHHLREHNTNSRELGFLAVV